MNKSTEACQKYFWSKSCVVGNFNVNSATNNFLPSSPPRRERNFINRFESPKNREIFQLNWNALSLGSCHTSLLLALSRLASLTCLKITWHACNRSLQLFFKSSIFYLELLWTTFLTEVFELRETVKKSEAVRQLCSFPMQKKIK